MEQVGRIPLVRRRRKKPWGPWTKFYFFLFAWSICFLAYDTMRIAAGIRVPIYIFCGLVQATCAFYNWQAFQWHRKRDEGD